MVRLQSHLALVGALAAVVGFATAMPKLGTPRCSFYPNTTEPFPVPDTSMTLCDADISNFILRLCSNRGGVESTLKHEVSAPVSKSGCNYSRQNRHMSLNCLCCVYGPCRITELYDYCRCATIQPPYSA